MAFYQTLHTQKIPTSLENVWDFISSPHNLKDITPAYMRFEVTSKGDASKMYPGMIITYNVRPLLGIKMKWMTEITTVEPMKYFVDEQRSGPYTMWHHQHHIVAIEGGVLMTDIVTYIPPMGFLGAMANSIFIEKQLKDIFDFRHKAVEDKFGVFK
jgi:ligand-binding SRPBCC domain-containing protein